MDTTCDFNPLKEELKSRMHGIVLRLQHTLQELEQENQCLLNEFEQIREEISRSEALAASFYLKCYLSSYTDKYSEISRTVRNLSERRYGALIVVQREDTLDRLMTPGVLIGANLTHALLESVFIPGGPLHDGAVLIRRNQIVSASNVLPLSETAATDKKLGTRHRAALGLSERSDALVIVVSEETGRASFSLQGNLFAFAVQ